MAPTGSPNEVCAGLLAVPRTLPTIPIAQIEPFELPGFRVGTLDSLLALSETLCRHDSAASQLAAKIAQEFPAEFSLSTDGLRVPLRAYCPFRWNQAKYGSVEQCPLAQLFQFVWRQVEELEQGFRTRHEQYAAAKQNWQALEQAYSGGLSYRPLSSIVRPEQILETEHLLTVFLLLKARDEDTFLRTYESSTPHVVPRSATLLARDDEEVLYSVVVFRKGLTEFVRAARERRYQVREYQSEADSTQGSLEERLAKARIHWQQLGHAFREWITEAYAECIDALVHLKVLRLFVEGVLRYGVPVSFAAGWILYDRSKIQKIRKTLQQALHTPEHRQILRHVYREAGEQIEMPSIPGLSAADMELPYDEDAFVWLPVDDAIFRQ